jgi:heterodisulfide reductase subunit C
MNNTEKELQKRVFDMSNVNVRKCMKCGKCSASCPAYDDMDIRPHKFVSLVEKGDIDMLMNSKSIMNCIGCFACVERCPRSVEPANIIEAVRLLVIRKAGQNRFKPADVPVILNDKIPQQAIVSALRKFGK